ncbi:hypothetical protein [Sulfitobacter guttiformis]|uniref:Uncharacterized protein n=1 Tax=Sulfitobacter guttiformis TaxID=74349 RepID=A0A420DJ37_9RHOB|nr:hypothetical protein [Sulfitobacter guttiformis]KIN71956.1 hypothetical protein Z949_1122 [Sulfitobacter guttiformis KCTC 32187]RKE94243.1 hypothetical protein C8N30_3361 [Sulfitobacter guttiformis]
MKSFLLACIAIIVIAVGAGAILNATFQTNSINAFATEGARPTIGEQNLISD